jgi:hypothetical protein
MLDNTKFSSVNSDAPEVVNGRGLAHRKLNRNARISLAADVAAGERQLVPSLAQVCAIFRVTEAAVGAELKVRAARENGQPSKDLAAAIVEAWGIASELEREVAVRTLGVAEVWNAIARVIA